MVSWRELAAIVAGIVSTTSSSPIGERTHKKSRTIALVHLHFQGFTLLIRSPPRALQGKAIEHSS